jgi:hypothetical protein
MTYQLTQEQVQQLKLLYGRRSDRELAQYFGVTISHIEDTARSLALGKDKATFKGRRMPRWTHEQLAMLIDLYADTDNLEIARRVGRTVKSVASKAHQLKLKKSVSRLEQMGRQNVSRRAGRGEDGKKVQDNR